MATQKGAVPEIISDIAGLGGQGVGVALPSGASLWIRLRERALFTLATMGVDLILLIGMTVLLVVTVLALGGRVRLFQPSVGFPISIMVAVVLSKLALNGQRPPETVPTVLRDWLPFVFISFIYENLYVFSKQIMTSDISPLIYRWDVALFGVEPTIWMQRFFSPWLTDVMAFSYALYFALPLGVMFFLSLKNERWWLRHMVMALTFVFIMGFLCYVFLPCNPPRYLIPHLYTEPAALYGVFLYDFLQGAWDGMSVISGGAFPSLHVGISAIALIYAFRFRHISALNRGIWFVTAPLVISLWISTVYLRHHWVIDIFAGWAVAAAATFMAEYAMRLGRYLRCRYSLEM